MKFTDLIFSSTLYYYSHRRQY